MSLDTTTLSNASHSLSAKAYDAAGNVGTSTTVTVTVNNGPRDTTAPTVSITSPANGATVARRSQVVISASASDDVGVKQVEFYVSGSLVGTSIASPYSAIWSVPGAKAKSYTITARAYDAAGNQKEASITIKSQ